MLYSLGLIFLVSLAMSSICKKIKLPTIIGMLISGVVLGPYILDFIDASILGISEQLRQMALIIILIKAGLSLNVADLKQVGRPAVLMSFVPALFEMTAYLIFAPLLFGISRVDALVMGAVLGAISPAIVVPRMIKLMENNYGTKKSIPQLILTGASCDDILVVVLFSVFVSISLGEQIALNTFLMLFVSIIFGVIVGAVLGYIVARFCNNTRNSVKVVIILSIALILVSIDYIATIPFSGLVAVVSMAVLYKIKVDKNIAQNLSDKFGKIWIVAEIILFVLVGAVVDVKYLLDAGLLALCMIFIGLIIRSVGVLVSLINTQLNAKEKLFCVISYLPKATVQAAIGSLPLYYGLQSGNLILSVAVLSIVITAPLGAIAIDNSYKKLLDKTSKI